MGRKRLADRAVLEKKLTKEFNDSHATEVDALTEQGVAAKNQAAALLGPSTV